MHFPADHDPLTPRVLATTAFPRTRTIVALRSDAKSDRYALHRFPDGSVWWRADTFTAPEHPADPEHWVGYGGELSVGAVIGRVPDQRRPVVDWTRGEIVSGVGAVYTDDPMVLGRRAQSLLRLQEELDGLARGPRRAA